MTGRLNKLTEVGIESLLRSVRAIARQEPSNVRTKLHGDGGGLTLQITKSGTASWLFRYMKNGKAYTLGLGPYPAVTLKKARDKAWELRRFIADGSNPAIDRKATAPATGTPSKVTFDQCAAEFIKDRWTNRKSPMQWTNTINTYASPVIGATPVAEITKAHLREILSPIWSTKTETASRLRARIEKVLNWASAMGYREGVNPAQWKGQLEFLLPRPPSPAIRRVHHPALPHQQLPGFMVELYKRDCIARWALELLILTACRTSEISNARWQEFDMESAIWTIPASRMKARVAHRVPLTARAIDILRRMSKLGSRDAVFARGQNQEPISNMAMAMLLRRMNRGDISVHGFRSTFRTYFYEEREHDFFTAEAALAHKLDSKVVAAYARSDLLAKRRRLMEDWEHFALSHITGIGHD
jgi:integrase